MSDRKLFDLDIAHERIITDEDIAFVKKAHEDAAEVERLRKQLGECANERASLREQVGKLGAQVQRLTRPDPAYELARDERLAKLEAENAELKDWQERHKYGFDFGQGTLYGKAETCALALRWYEELVELRRFYAKEKELAEARARLAWFEERDTLRLDQVKAYYGANINETDVLQAIDELITWEREHPKPE
jgi:predicted nuclease with TOPRIM domain